MGLIFQPIPDFFLAIETVNEPSPSINPVTNQGFKLPSSIVDNFGWILLLFELLVVEYCRLFRIGLDGIPGQVILSDPLRVYLRFTGRSPVDQLPSTRCSFTDI